ncbi:MAG: arginine--tRNA ligase [Planctomyces sp.]|nr:arginine--tRNA ligase [Planctomyces sp.]
MSLLNELRSRFATALAEYGDEVPGLLEMIRVAQDPKFGDFQANFAMSLSKKVGKPPRDIATTVCQKLDVSDLCETPEVAGPGFINLRFRDSLLAARVSSIVGDDRLGVSPVKHPRHVVVDFSSPNVAKPMHVGHLRSTVIGDAICRTLRFAGHQVTSDNHIGDWGTQFGMIIYGYRNFVNMDAYRAAPVAELARLYKLVNQLSDYHATKAKLPQLKAALEGLNQQRVALKATENADPKKYQKAENQLVKQIDSAREAVESAEKTLAVVESDEHLSSLAAAHPTIARLARDETARLHAGDASNQALWDEFLPECLKALQVIYDRLGIQFDLTLGESFYNPMLPSVVETLAEKGLARSSDGAQCVFIEGNTAPFIVQKSDGAYTYATTDLATIRYRRDELKANEILYVVDNRQSEHFQLLFSTAALWGYDDMTFRHVSFGTVMDRNGKPYKTRAGDTVGLESLIDEAINRSRPIVNENDDRREVKLLNDSERAAVAEIVAVGGIKYADLHHNRDSDYVFDWDKMLATTGDTAAAIQYAYARICGIFRKLQISRSEIADSHAHVLITCPEERALCLQLLQFEFAIENVLYEYRPHLLTAWLYETSDRFSKFYDRCSVQDAETDELRQSRLILCDLIARGLKTGLSLLGIETADVM